MSDIWPLSSEHASASLFGGKAYSLARALAAGHKVPPGFVISAEASLESLQQSLDTLGEGPFAVRSSAVAEDSASQSFAGQLETFLTVANADVLRSVERCRASADALRVLRYGGAGPVAVLVQKMIPAEVAGVAFSADPRTGERGVVLIEAVRGLGDRLVSGEATPESWRVESSKVTKQASDVLTQAQATEIAALARQMESLFGAPQDIEWAIAAGALYLLQSRLITALPAAPVPIPIEIPQGDWQRDDHHAVLSPLGWAWFQAYPKAMAIEMAKGGVPVKEIKVTRVGGHLYQQMIMDGGGGGKVPPRWVLWLVSRLLPSMRRANRAAEEMMDKETYCDLIARWESEIRPEMRRAIEALFVEDPSAMSDAALLTRIQEAMALCARGLTHHAGLGGPPMLAVGKLALFIKAELSWPMDKSLELLAGHSEKTTELHRSIEKIVAQHEHEAELLGAEPPSTWAALLTRAPQMGAALLNFAKENRLRVLHYDPKHPTLAEQPQLLLYIVDSIIHSRRNPSPSVATPGQALMEEARRRLSVEKMRELERLLERARRAYGVRDENGIETVARPSGLLRWFVVELGRRIESEIGRPEYAVYLYPEEHAAALQKTLPNINGLIERRRGEESWAIQHRGPALFGQAPPEMPVDAFPRGLATMFTIFDWMMKGEAPKEESARGQPLVGTGLGSKIVTARARVVERVEQLGALRHGEILVCRITSPEWAVALGRVAALVTNEGGILSHPAIIAREYGITAVIGATNATQRIQTGDMLRVDPLAGTVSIIDKGGR